MKKIVFMGVAGITLMGMGFSHASTDIVDKCGSPKEVFTKYALDKCYAEYFNAILENKKKAADVERRMKALEDKMAKLDSKVNDMAGRLDALEGKLNELENKIKESIEPSIRVEATVYFAFDKFTLSEKAKQVLDGIVEQLKDKNITEILIIGFADPRGTNRYNYKLSMERAQSVASYLVKKGVDMSRIRMASYGEELANMIGKTYREQRAVKVLGLTY